MNIIVTPYQEYVSGVGDMTVAYRVTIADTGETIVPGVRRLHGGCTSALDVAAWLNKQFEASGELPLMPAAMEASR